MTLLLGGWLAGEPAAFEGRVALPDGSPARGATVVVVGRSGSVETDGEGRFRWQPDPPTPFALIVLLDDGRLFGPIRIETLPADEELLVAAPDVTESVLVTAEAAPDTSVPAASALTLVSRESLERVSPQRLADVLDHVPGASRPTGGHDAVPSLRGMARGRTLVLLDGARVTTERRAGASATFLDPFFLEAVEVVRGPGSVAYGSDAIGGVVHARTPTPVQGAAAKLRFVTGLGFGTPERTAGIEYGQGFAEGAVLVQARHREFENYRSPAGEVFNSSAEDHGLLAKIEREAAGGMLSLGLREDIARDVGKPLTDSRTRQIFYPEEVSRRLTFGWRRLVRATGVEVQGFLGTHNLTTDQRGSATPTSPATHSRADVSARDLGLRAVARRPVSTGHLEVGLDLGSRFGLEAADTLTELDADGNPVTTTRTDAIEDATRTTLAAFATYEAPLGRRATIEGGVRADRVTTRNEGGAFGRRQTRHGAFSGFGAVTGKLPRGLELSGMVSRGFRDPTLSDRYFVGPSGRGHVTGNPDLDPERTLQVGVALRGGKEPAQWALHAYRYRIQDLVERFEQGDGLFFFRNRGRARVSGLELEARVALPARTVLELGAHALRGEAVDDGASLDEVPADGLRVQISKELARHGYVGFRAAWSARDHRPGPTESVTPGHLTLDLHGGTVLGRGLELRAVIGNVLDREYPASADSKGVAAPGRSASLRLVGRFGGSRPGTP